MKQLFRCLDHKGRPVITVEAFGAINAARAIFKDRPARMTAWTVDDILKRIQVQGPDGVWTNTYKWRN